MKKLIKLIPIIAALPALLTGCKETPKISTFEIENKLETINYYQGDDFNISPSTIGSLIPTFKVTYENGSSEIISSNDKRLSFEGFNSSIVGTQQITASFKGLETTYEVNIVDVNKIIIDVQPKVIETEPPRGVNLTVEVRKESLVKEYQWQAFNSYDIDDNPVYLNIDGTSAKTKEFKIHSVTSSPSTGYFRCQITSLDGENYYSEEGGYIVINPEEDIAGAYFADYPIIPGETLDLSKTLFGSGTISLSKDKTTYTFTNVNFHNEEYETGSILTHICFEICNWKNSLTDIYLNFVGDNIFDNKYWEYDAGQGGFTFAFNFLGSETTKPVLHFKGDGTITSKGGTGLIYANTAIEIDKLKIKIETPESNRFDKGIICRNLIMRNGASINASLGSEIVFIERGSDDPFMNGLYIHEGCSITGNINAGKVIGNYTTAHALYAANDVLIEGATIDIKVSIDVDFFEESYQSLSLDCVASNSGQLTITNSSVKISVKSLNTESYFIPCDNVEAISAKTLEIDNSDVNVSIHSRNIMSCMGIYSKFANIKNNSDIKVDVYCSGNGEGIIGITTLGIENSDVDVNVDCLEIQDYPYVVGGIRTSEFVSLTLAKGNTIHVEVNDGYTIAVPFGEKTMDMPTPQIGYVASKIPLTGLIVAPEGSKLNQGATIKEYDYDFETDEVIITYSPIETFFDEELSSQLKTITLSK